MLVYPPPTGEVYKDVHHLHSVSRVSPTHGGSLSTSPPITAPTISIPHPRGKFISLSAVLTPLPMYLPHAGEVYRVMVPVRITELVSPTHGGSLFTHRFIKPSMRSIPHTWGKFIQGRLDIATSALVSPVRGKFMHTSIGTSIRAKYPPHAGEVYELVAKDVLVECVSPVRGKLTNTL